MSPKGKLICFTGIDGAGKTTLSRYLTETLNSRGLRYKYVYGRFLPVLVRPFWAVGRLLFARSKDFHKDYSEYNSTKKTRLQNPFFARLHEFLLSLDYIMQVLAKITIPLMFGAKLVCDRYVYDTVITDMAPDLGYSDDEVAQKIHLFFKFMPKPDLVFLIDVDESTTLKRKTDIPDIQYLTDRRKIYAYIKPAEDVVRLNGNLSLDENKLMVEDVMTRFLEKS
jgi:thymidylate kinase